jgi:hypothetical protein
MFAQRARALGLLITSSYRSMWETTARASLHYGDLLRTMRKIAGLPELPEPKVKLAPCLTCDGAIVVWSRAFARGWCRCRCLWSAEAIVRGGRVRSAR